MICYKLVTMSLLPNSKLTLEKTKGAIKNRSFIDIGNIGHTRHRTKTNKTNKHNTMQYRKLIKWAKRIPPTKREWTQVLVKG